MVYASNFSWYMPLLPLRRACHSPSPGGVAPDVRSQPQRRLDPRSLRPPRHYRVVERGRVGTATDEVRCSARSRAFCRRRWDCRGHQDCMPCPGDDLGFLVIKLIQFEISLRIRCCCNGKVNLILKLFHMTIKMKKNTAPNYLKPDTSKIILTCRIICVLCGVFLSCRSEYPIIHSYNNNNNKKVF
jgi:hypothetical protein